MTPSEAADAVERAADLLTRDDSPTRVKLCTTLNALAKALREGRTQNRFVYPTHGADPHIVMDLVISLPDTEQDGKEGA